MGKKSGQCCAEVTSSRRKAAHCSSQAGPRESCEDWPSRGREAPQLLSSHQRRSHQAQEILGSTVVLGASCSLSVGLRTEPGP